MEMTSQEGAFWGCVRHGLLGFRVRRQYPCAGYILDFYVPSAKLCIEVDGPFHDAERDRIRDGVLAELGVLTVRIIVDEMLWQEDRWSDRIREMALARREYLRRQ